jgi:DNA mismatch repair protein MutS2
LLDARQEVEAAIREAGREDLDGAKRARRVMEEAITTARDAIDRLDAAEKAEADVVDRPIATGQRVRLAAGGTGIVVDMRGDGKVVVALGAMKMVVPAGELTPVAGQAPAPRPPTPEFAVPDAPSEIDLRGFRGDEAEQATAAALDAAVLGEQAFLRIIHGMGTGVVRERVRRLLSADRRVKSYEFAPPAQGGTGVTIVWFGDR